MELRHKYDKPAESHKYDMAKIEVALTAGTRLKQVKAQKPFVGLDTETENGKAVMITNSDGKYLISEDTIEYLDFLYGNNHLRTSNFFFNLDYDVRGIIKGLSDRLRRNLYVMDEIEVYPYRIRYMPNKVFRLSKWSEKHKKHLNTAFFYDIAQHFGMSLKDSALFFKCEQLKGSVEDIEFITFDKLTSNSSYREEILKYCINDSVVCKELTEKFIGAVSKIYPVTNYLSIASMSREILRHNMRYERLGMPRSYAMYQAALNAYQAGYNETPKLGYFDKYYEYDINSAYPSVMISLDNPNGAIISGNKEYEPDASYSYFKVQFDLSPDVYLSPLFHHYKGAIYHPIGENLTFWISKSEYEYLSKITDLKILDSKHIFSDEPDIFKEYITTLYEARKEAKKDNNQILQLAFKKLMVAPYGSFININSYKTFAKGTTPVEQCCMDGYIDEEGQEILLEANKRAGMLFCPPVAAEITSQTRILLFNAFKGHEKSIMTIATDGFKTFKKINSIKVSGELGDYSYEESPEGGFMLGNHRFVVYKDGLIDDEASRGRGMSMKPSILIETLKQNPDSIISGIMDKHVVTLYEDTHTQRYAGHLNEFIKKMKRVSIGVPSRAFNQHLFTYNDLLDGIHDSLPLSIERVPKHHKDYRTSKGMADKAFDQNL